MDCENFFFSPGHLGFCYFGGIKTPPESPDGNLPLTDITVLSCEAALLLVQRGGGLLGLVSSEVELQGLLKDAEEVFLSETSV